METNAAGITTSAENCPLCNKPYSGHVEYWYGSPERYDGISEHVCTPCNIRVGRWTGLILKEGEVEPRFGDGTPYVPVDCPKCDNKRNPKWPTCFDCYEASLEPPRGTPEGECSKSSDCSCMQ